MMDSFRADVVLGYTYPPCTMLAIFSHTPAANVPECLQRQLVAKMAASTSTKSLDSRLWWMLHRRTVMMTS